MKAYRNLLAESPRYRLEHEYETVYVIDKTNGTEIAAGDHYGDPQFGLITPDEVWFVTAGDGILCHHVSGERVEYFRPGKEPFLRGTPVGASTNTEATGFVHSLRLEGPALVRILIDPWSENASVWQLDLSRRELIKVRDGPFIDGPYEEDVPY